MIFLTQGRDPADHGRPNHHPDAMIRLRTLGSLDLSSSDGRDLSGVVAQPKRGGLLVYLALAGRDEFRRRDQLLALLWPDLDEQRGRTALRQAVYRMRQVLGRDAIISRGDEELRLDPGQVECDTVEFDRLMEEGRTADALALHRGEFLAAFHVTGASEEWDEWVEKERLRWRLKAREGCTRLARQEEQRGNGVGAAAWLRRAVELAPDDETVVRTLLELLLRLGDRSGALRVGTDFSRRHREEFGAEPSAALTRLLDQARRATPPPRNEAPISVPPRDQPPIPVPARDEAPIAAATLPSLASAEAPVGPNGAHRKPILIRWWLAAIVIPLLIAGVLWTSRRTPPDPALVAVGAIRQLSPAGDRIPVEVLRDLLATGLATVPGLEVISGPRLVELEAQLGTGSGETDRSYQAARLAGANLLVDGDVRHDGDSLRLVLRATDLGRGAIRYTTAVAGTTLFTLADAATARVAERSGAPAPVRHIEELSTGSEIAYRFYQEGLRAYYSADRTAARRLFAAAIQEDSSFALAWLYASQAEDEPARSKSLLAGAVQRASGAPDRERLTIMAHWAIASIDPAARAYAETLVVRYPAEPASLLMLAQSRAEFGDATGTLEPARRVIQLDSLGAAGRGRNCYACDAYRALVQAYLELNQPAPAESVAREYLRRQPQSPIALEALSGLLIRLDRDRAADSVLAKLDTISRPGPRILWNPWLRRGEFGHLEAEIADGMVRGTADERVDARWWRTILLRTEGRLTGAGASAREDGGILEAQVLCESGHGAEGARRFEAIANQVLNLPSDPSVTTIEYHRAKHRAWHLTHAATCLALAGDTARLAELADTIEQVGARSSWPRDQRLHFYVRGLLARARGDPTGAAAAFRQAISSPVNGLTRINYELAGVLLELGRPREAIDPLQAALRGPVDAGGLYLTRTEIEERLAEAFSRVGERDSARVHAVYVARAWQGADPAFRARWERAVRDAR